MAVKWVGSMAEKWLECGLDGSKETANTADVDEITKHQGRGAKG